MDKDKLIALLYFLMRDVVPLGEVARIVQEIELNPPPYNFTNSHLMAYCQDIVERLK